jgi:hypothetical protein
MVLSQRALENYEESIRQKLSELNSTNRALLRLSQGLVSKTDRVSSRLVFCQVDNEFRKKRVVWLSDEIASQAAAVLVEYQKDEFLKIVIA